MANKLSVIYIMIAIFAILAPRVLAIGPNLMSNSSFEEGTGDQYTLSSNFVVVYNPANAHTGSWELQADLDGGDGSASQPVSVSANTSYTSSIWIKGSGSLTFRVLGSNGRSSLATTMATASSNWNQVSLTFNSGSFTQVAVELVNNQGSGTMYIDDESTGLTAGNDILFSPSSPGSSGFSYLWGDEFSNSSTIDMNASGANGFHWYPQQFFVGNTPASDYSVSGGDLLLSGAIANWGQTLNTAYPANNSNGYAGTIFSAGGGVYFEARLAISDPGSTGTSLWGTSWPAWWMDDMKEETGLDNAMPGNPTHTEAIECDFMENNSTWGRPWDYPSSMHDWSAGVPNGNIADETWMCLPTTTDFTQYHTYGLLWVPGTAANGWNGYRQPFCDGVPGAAICWVGNQVGTWPPSGTYLYSLMDQDKFDLILATGELGPGVSVDYVHVYGASIKSVTVVDKNGTAGSPPSGPTSLTATGSPGQIALAWTASTGATSYNIYRGISAGGEATTRLGTSGTSGYTDTNVANGITYYYTVVGVNSLALSVPSNEASAKSNIALLALTGLTATGGAGEVTLDWTASAGATSYNIYRGISAGGESSTPIGTSTTASYPDTNVANGVTYYYTVVAVNSLTLSSPSNEASATSDVVPLAPTALIATAGTDEISLTWTGSTGATSYNIYRGISAGGENATSLGASSTTTYTDMTVENGVTYYYTVVAVNSLALSLPSNEASAESDIVPLTPTVLTAKGGAGAVSLSWTASTGDAAFDLYRSTTSGGESGHEIASGITKTTFTDSGLANSTTYYYTIVGVNGILSSNPSSEASATTNTVITGFNISPSSMAGGSTTGGTITLSGAAPAAGYSVGLTIPSAAQTYASVPATVTVPSGASSFNFTGIKTHTVSTTQSVTVTAALGASSLSAGFSITPIAGGTQQPGMSFFSLPWSYNDTLPDIFVSPLTPGTIANWNGTSYIYQGASSADPTSVTISLGKAYWAVFSTIGDSLIYLGAPASTTTPITVVLTAGWNTIGNPYTTPTPISSLTFGANRTTFAAASATLISPTLYSFVPSSDTYWPAGSGSSLIPGQGYWIYANTATTLTFPLTGSTNVSTTTTTTTTTITTTLGTGHPKRH